MFAIFHPGRTGTCVRVQRRGEHPACGPRLVLRVGRAARRSAAARASGDRGGGGRAGRLATRRRRSGSRRAMPGRHGARAVPARDRGVAALRRLQRGVEGGVRDLRRHGAAGRGDLDRRGVHRRARDAADRGRAGRDRRAAARAVREEVGLPITVGVARTKFLAKVASGVAKPDGLLLVEPARELEFLHPLPVEKLWGVGVKTADKLHARGIIDGGGGGGAVGARAGRDARARPRGASCTRWRTSATRGRVTVGVRRRSIGGQRAIGRRGRPKTPEQLDETLVGADRPDHAAAAGGAAGRADGDPAAALRRLHARDALADDRAGVGGVARAARAPRAS